ncbi:MAG: ATP-binding protein [Bdellovibrionales bacterium]
MSFDFYLSSVGEEIVGSWLQSETVAIQEGNLLTTITKNQRVLMSSQFVKGVVLLDTSTSPPQRLIEFGSSIPTVAYQEIDPGKLTIIDSGFLDKKTFFRISHRPELLLIFDIHSTFLVKAFAATVLLFMGFVLVLFLSIKRVEGREFRRREKFIKDALSELVESERSSPVIREEFPFLAEWWNAKRKEIDLARKHAVENESKIMFGELAARVAHDIRSPLNTLKVVSDSAVEMPDATRLLLDRAIQRIREVASGLMDKNKALMAREASLKGSTSTLLFPVIQEVFEEKRLQYASRKIDFKIEISPRAKMAFAAFQEDELKRTLSNLIDNSVEACADKVFVTLSTDDRIISISVKDSGIGIPPSAASRIGEKGFSFGKENGSGLGIYYAKQIVQQWNGDFKIASSEDNGTSVLLSLPMADVPACLVSDVDISSKPNLLILDDDPSIHEIWKTKIQSHGLEIAVEHFFDSRSLLDWARSNKKGLQDCLLLSDFDLYGSSDSGLDVIDRGGFRPENTFLITNSYNSKTIQDKCLAMGVKVLPKPVLTLD